MVRSGLLRLTNHFPYIMAASTTPLLGARGMKRTDQPLVDGQKDFEDRRITRRNRLSETLIILFTRSIDLRKRFYIMLVARNAEGELLKIPIPMHYVYVFIAGALIGMLTI